MDIGYARYRSPEEVIKRAREWESTAERSVNINSVQVERVICVKTTEGTGTETDPFRVSKRFFTFAGAYIGMLGREDESFANPNESWEELEKRYRNNFSGLLTPFIEP
ncbi:MAG: hypothetical protein IKK11_05660 [Oscillospiraceae bacterium]|nr:hypothetical protein [Oscillospiraceae bacterium]